MSKIRVVVTYKNDLERITIDNVDMDISIIQNKAISEWFEPSNGRDGWRGLISEIKDKASDDSGELAFEFNGNEKAKSIFEKVLKEYGYSCITAARSNDEVVSDCFEEAERLIRQGNFEKAIEQYEIAANAGSVEAEYQIANMIIYGNYDDKIVDNIDDNIELAMKICEKAIKYCTLAAEHCDPRAQYTLGTLYWKGDIVDQDDQIAAEWIEKSAEQGNADAQYLLGLFYLTGIGVKPDFIKAAELFEKSAEQGHIDAQLYIGSCYSEGNGVERDDKKAAEWFEKAANQGNDRAQCLLGACYFHGAGVEEDHEKAIYWFKASAEQGLSDAWNELAECYLADGKTDKAISCFNKAVDGENTSAMIKLGECYEWGNIVPEDEKTAFEYYKRAGDLNDPEGLYEEALCYLYEIGVEKNTNTAVELINAAADIKYAPAQNFLGELYLKGDIVPQDHKKASELFKEAADSGNLVAICNLGRCYLNGFGVEKNFKKAFDYFKDSAEYDYAEGQNMVGECYQNGWGVTNDEFIAYQYYKKAADQNCYKAKYNLGMCYMSGRTVALNPSKAVELFEQSYDSVPEASYQLGICYLKGIGTVKDEYQAELCFEVATRSGYTEAEYALGKMYLSSDSSYKKQEARNYLQKAADKGHIGAKYELGQSYLNGTGGKNDYSLALNLLLEVVDSNDSQYAPLAMYSIGLIYYNGFGKAKDGSVAEIWFIRSSIRGVKEAYGMIGQIYYLGEFPGLKNVNTAATYLLKGYDKNDPISRKNLLSKRFVQEAIVGLSSTSDRCRLRDILSNVVNNSNLINEFAHNSSIIFASNAKKFLLIAIEQLKLPVKK